MKAYELTSKKESGFTLVELAIVMIIIGLLIGGILKGQELIKNAEISAGVSQIKAVDAAVSTFRDAYNAFPGDLAGTAGARIPNCTAAPCTTATGAQNGRLDTLPSVAPNIGNDGAVFWAHLSAADIFGGLSSSAAAVGLGQSHPQFEVGSASALRVGYNQNGALAGDLAAVNARGGHYIGVGDMFSAMGTAAASQFTALEVFRLDTKLDDGAPNTGFVRGAGNGACVTGGAANSTYITSGTTPQCSMYARIQG